MSLVPKFQMLWADREGRSITRQMRVAKGPRCHQSLLRLSLNTPLAIALMIVLWFVVDVVMVMV